MNDISWQLTVIIITFILAVTVILVVHLILKNQVSNINFNDKLQGVNTDKETLEGRMKNDALRNNPTIYNIFIASPICLTGEHNAIKAAISDSETYLDCYEKGLKIIPLDFGFDNRQFEYDKIIENPNTHLFILILDCKIDSTYEITEKEFEKALSNQNIEIIIFEKFYENPITHEVIERIKKSYNQSCESKHYINYYKDDDELKRKCEILISGRIRNEIFKRKIV